MGMRAAINGMCKACIYDPHSGLGTWRQQTEACTSRDCPLWPYRPKSSPRAKDGPKSARSAPTVEATAGPLDVKP